MPDAVVANIGLPEGLNTAGRGLSRLHSSDEPNPETRRIKQERTTKLLARRTPVWAEPGRSPELNKKKKVASPLT